MPPEQYQPNVITDEQVGIALLENAETDGERWRFHRSTGTPYWHGEEDALAIVKACLLLRQPVTDVATGKTWLAMVERVTTLEDRIATLELAMTLHEHS